MNKYPGPQSVVDVDEAVPQRGGSDKLRRAGEVARKTEEELVAICQGLNDRISELGIQVNDAAQYRGLERILHTLGAAGSKWAARKAAVSRRERLKALRTEDAVAEIGRTVQVAIQELGESESEYEVDQRTYEERINEVLTKQHEATPLYIEARAKREKIEAETETLEKAVAAAPLGERPKYEQLFEKKKRELDAAQLDETTFFAVVKNAQEAIPELQKSRDAATKAIHGLHGMRQSMLEKFADYRVILERATTAMRARASVELFEDVDPAFNGAITSIQANNVATAGAVLDVWVERIQHAAVDPARSQELLRELLGHILESAQKMEATAAVVAGGPRKPLLIEDQRQKLAAGLTPLDMKVHDRERVGIPARRP